MTDNLEIYNFSWALYPRRIHIYLSEKGLDIKSREYDPKVEKKWPPPEVLELNPYGKLPILKIDNENSITESLAIIHYLEKVFPNPSMIGENAIDYANVIRLTTMADEANTILAIWNHNISPVFQERELQFKDAGYSGAYYFIKRLDVLETAINESHEFIYGNSPTIADCVTFPLIMFLDEFYDVRLPRRFKKLNAWYKRFKTRDSITQQNYVDQYPDSLLELSRGLEKQGGFFLEDICNKLEKDLLN
ncbi:glutathione S-transferase family protein [Microbulbifer sp. SSSA008]|uniref:glutathione S-transferase family protein n=1 Tax=unclassified Microbulbifer TaxID=2619833 RepID=UPI004039FFDC